MNHFLKTLLLSVFLVPLANRGMAQDNYTPGNVVTLQGDTLRGRVNDQRWQNSPAFIEFSNSNGTISKYRPGEIKGFQITGKSNYISAVVDYDSTSQKVDVLPSSSQPAYKRGNYFLKYHVQGKASLLILELQDRLHMFIQLNSDNLVELVNHKYRVYGNMLENKMYILQLQRAFAECASVKIGVNLSYSTTAIGNLFQRYNECVGGVSQVFTKKERTLVKLGLIGFVGYDQFRRGFEGGIGTGGGAYVTLQFPNKNYMLSYTTELAYRQMASQTRQPETYEINSIQWSHLIRFRVFPRYERLLLGGGFSFSNGLDDTYKYRYSATHTSVATASTQIITTILGSMVWKVNKHALIEFRYENGDQIDLKNIYNGNMSRTSSFRLGLGWQF